MKTAVMMCIVALALAVPGEQSLAVGHPWDEKIRLEF